MTTNRRKFTWTVIFLCAFCLYFIFFSADLDTNIKVHYKYQNATDLQVNGEKNRNQSDHDYEDYNDYERDFTEGEWDWQELVEIGGQDDWQEGTKFYVYSAFFDFYKEQNVIRIISVTPTPSSSRRKLYCHVLDENLELMLTIPGEIKLTVGSPHSRMYSPGFILCKLDAIGAVVEQELLTSQMKYVSVSEGSLPYLSNLLKIMVTPENEEAYSFGACVQPTFNYDKVLDFVQWLEYNKMMGVRHFTFYNMSIGPGVSCVMKSLAANEETPIVILNWTMPINVSDILHVNGQLSQINDCAYRYRGVSKYVVSVDMDEYIVPNYGIALNYKQLVDHIDVSSEVSKHGHTIAGYQFRSAFFSTTAYEPSGRSKDEFAESDQVELEDLFLYRYITLFSNLYLPGWRSKSIFVPKLSVEPGLHYMLEAVKDAVEFEVPYQKAYIHHYRYTDECVNCSTTSEHETDTTGMFFADDLLQRVRKIMKKLENECSFEIKELRNGYKILFYKLISSI